MATPTNCPQCGSALPEGANMCPNCGHQLQLGDSGAQQQQPQPHEPPPPYAPAGGPAPAARTASAGDQFNDFVVQTLERWNVTRSPVLMTAGLLVLIAVLVSTMAHISYLTSGEGDFGQKIDAQVWFNFAIGSAIGAAALVLLVRLQSGPPAAADMNSPDFRAGAVLMGLVLLFCLFGLFKGLGEGFNAQDSWFTYAQVFAFLTVGWFILTRPVPEAVAGTAATMIGLLLVGIAGGALLIGQFMGLSDDNSTYITGVSFQALGIVAMVIALGWFLGLDRRQA